MNKKYTVFVSSTYEDLKEERQEVMQALLEMDCIPCGMELFPAADEEQFEFIKSIIDDCDYYVLILAGKYGSTNQDGISYTELEFQYALDKNIPIISFIHNDIGSLPNNKCEHNKEKIKKLNSFNALAKKKLCKFWTNKENLAGLVSRSMIQLVRSHPSVGWVRANQVSNEETLAKITQLYEENRELKNLCEKTPTKKFLIADKLLNVDFNIYNKGETRFAVDNISILTTWGDLFMQIGPTLIEENIRFTIEELLCDIAIQEHFKKLNNEKINNFKENQFIKISEHSIGEILVQFLALNYITVNHPNHNNDFELSTSSTYVLTELGRNALIELSTKQI